MNYRVAFERNTVALSLQSQVRGKWIEAGFCCFPLPNRGPKEDGGRNAKIQTVILRTRRLIWQCMRGSCRLPRSMASSENGKIVHQEQFGAPARNHPNRRRACSLMVNHLQFITAIPPNVRRGSGCYVG